MEPVDLEALAADVLTNHLPRAEANQIELSFDLQSNLPPAWADRAKIVQVLTNLVGNALAYTPAGGHVTVSLSQDNSDGRAYIMMAVADDGPGISPKDKPHIFERFYRGAAGRQSAAPGTGLGLSICKKIVDLHEGRINVESEEGQGATFNVWLPVSPRDGG
jgi:signal transduction histidine kinase